MKGIFLIAACAVLISAPAFAADENHAAHHPAGEPTQQPAPAPATQEPAKVDQAPAGSCPMMGSAGMMGSGGMMSGSSMQGGAMNGCMTKGSMGQAGNNGMMSGSAGAGMPACSATIRDHCMESAGHMVMHKARGPHRTRHRIR
jgi:hypothetical protein